MAIHSKLLDQMSDKSATLARKKELVAKLIARKKPARVVKSKAEDNPAPIKIMSPDQSSPAAEASLPRIVTIEGDGIMPLYVEGERSPQHLSTAMRKLADVCLEAAQYRTREVILLWPGKLDCLTLPPTLASIALWAKGYKRGLRTVFYPATQHSFYPLNHIKADRATIHEIVNQVSEVSGSGPNPAVKESCPQKDLMMFAINSLGPKTNAAKLQPGLAELCPHFYLTTDDKNELRGQNYKGEFLNQLITKLSCRGHTASLRKDTLPYLGDPLTAPDAVFALSHQMKKKDMIGALRNIKAAGAPDVFLIDATQSSFRRTEDLRKRVVKFLGFADEVFGSIAPGIVVVTDDPQQMTQLRASISREVELGKLRRFQATRGLCHPGHNNGLESQAPPEILSIRKAIDIKVEVTDKESAKLMDQAYRYRGQMQAFPETAAALGDASAFLRKMGNLPSTSQLLRAWLDDSLAEPQQRRGYDWLAYRNKLTQAMSADLPAELLGKLKAWRTRADQMLESYEAATPLAFALDNRIADYRKKKYNTLVVLASPFYVRLAEHFLLGSGTLAAGPSGEPKLQPPATVKLITGRSLKEEIRKGWATRLVLGFVNADILRQVMTDRHIPTHVDFLLTQSAATSIYYSLKPVLDYADFAPYHARVKVIMDQLSRVKMEGGGVLPPMDWEPHAFSSTLPASDTSKEAYTKDMVKVSLEDGRSLIRGRHSVEFVYDPASPESQDLGFKLTYSDKLSVGDRIFVMSSDLHELAESIFRSAGVKLSSGDNLESLLRLYHKQVLAKVKEQYQGHIMDRVRGLRADLVKAHPEMSDEFANIRYWIALDDSPETPFEQLMPQAPRSQAHFRVFMETLGFGETQIKLFWEGAIRQVRGTRIADGRYFGDQYSRALFDPGAAATYSKVPRESLRLLRERALDDIYEVTALAQLAASTQGETQ